MSNGQMRNGRTSATPGNACWTLLLPVLRDCGQVPARPRKSSQDSVAAAFQGLWKITTHIWHQASPLFHHQRMWPPSGVCWDQVASAVSPNVLPAVEPLLPVWPENLPDPTLFLGIHPSHQSTAGMELRSCRLCYPCLQSQWNVNPLLCLFSFLPF